MSARAKHLVFKPHWNLGARPARVVIAVLLLLVATLTSCAKSAHPADAAAPVATSTVHNAADIAFAQMMIPHHQQAVVLAAMVPAHTANPELRVMATHIGASQQAEIRTLNGLLATWSQPTVDPNGPSATQHSPMMMGMVDQATLDRLQTLNDQAFDTLWVTSMIGHHQGAITMAQDEIAHGQSPDAMHTATLIVTAQQREIAQMTHLISAAQ